MCLVYGALRFNESLGGWGLGVLWGEDLSWHLLFLFCGGRALGSGVVSEAGPCECGSHSGLPRRKLTAAKA